MEERLHPVRGGGSITSSCVVCNIIMRDIKVDWRKFNPQDHVNKVDIENGWYLDKPEPGFSVKHNMEVIRKTVEINKRVAELRRKQHIDEVGERAHAVSYFLTSKKIQSFGATNKSLSSYFGNKELAYLRGQDIVHTIKSSTKSVWTPNDLVTLRPNVSKT